MPSNQRLAFAAFLSDPLEMARTAKPDQRRSERVSLFLRKEEYAELIRRAEALDVPVPPATLAAQLLGKALSPVKPKRRRR